MPSAFEQGLPSRHLPLSVQSAALFGGFCSQFGWLFFGFGMVFVWVFTSHADFSGLQFRGELETVQGTVVKCEPTSYSFNERRVHAISYTFTVSDATYEGTSYSTRSSFEHGAKVTVEYPKGRPALSRVKGAGRSPMPIWAGLLTLIFPLVGLVFIIVGLRSGLRTKDLLAHGLPAVGKLKSKTATATRVNKQTVYKITFEFVAEDGNTYEAATRTHQPRALEDQEYEGLLYDPMWPSRAVLMDSLPGSPRLDANGSVQCDQPMKGLLMLMLPALSIIGHGTWLYIKVLG